MEIGHAYIHANYRELSDPDFASLAKHLEQTSAGSAQYVFGSGVEFRYVLEEGTLIERVRVWGFSLAVLLDATSHYHDLRESVLELYADATKFGGVIVEQFSDIAGTKPADVISSRTTSLDVNRLHKVIQSVDALLSDGHDSAAAKNTLVSAIANFHQTNPDDRGIETLLIALPRDSIPGLPSTIEDVIAEDQRLRRASRPKSAHAEEPQAVEYFQSDWSRRPRRRYERTLHL